MRYLQNHHNGHFDALQIEVIDATQRGRPNFRYDITGFNTVYNPLAADTNAPPAQFTRLPIVFQNGPVIGDYPQNGVTVNALLAVVEDHLAGVQHSPEACREYEMALGYIRSALECLNTRIDVPYTSRSVYLGLMS